MFGTSVYPLNFIWCRWHQAFDFSLSKTLTFHRTCVNGNCSELAPHSHTLCSTTRIANRWWATHWAALQSSISSADRCEWIRCSSNSKHSAASPRQPNGKRRPANGPLANARRNGSGHSAGSELVCNCWNNSWKMRLNKCDGLICELLERKCGFIVHRSIVSYFVYHTQKNPWLKWTQTGIKKVKRRYLSKKKNKSLRTVKNTKELTTIARIQSSMYSCSLHVFAWTTKFDWSMVDE